MYKMNKSFKARPGYSGYRFPSVCHYVESSLTLVISSQQHWTDRHTEDEEICPWPPPLLLSLPGPGPVPHASPHQSQLFLSLGPELSTPQRQYRPTERY